METHSPFSFLFLLLRRFELALVVLLFVPSAAEHGGMAAAGAGEAAAPSSRRCMGDRLVAAAAPAPALFSGHTAGLGRQGSTQGKKCRWPLNIAYPPSNILLYANVCAVRREDHAAEAPESRVIREGEGWPPAAAAAASAPLPSLAFLPPFPPLLLRRLLGL